jgi:hypothetical protein
MHDYPKRIKRALRELAGEAYEQEMKREVSQLAESFDKWRAGKIDVWELDHRIHQYHNGPARELYNQYNVPSQIDMLVAYAIVRGIISEDRVPEELWPYLDRQLEFYRRLEQRYQIQLSSEKADNEER